MAWLRSLSAAFLPDVAEILRYTETNTADGVTQTWATVASDVRCRVSPIGSGAVERPGEGAGVVRALSEWTVWLPALTDVTARDRLTVTDGRTFEVQRVGERTYETVRDCVCWLLE